MNEKRLNIAEKILLAIFLLLSLVTFIKPDLRWASLVACICAVLDLVVEMIKIRLKRTDKKFGSKKVVFSIVLGAVFALAAIWIVLINVL